MLTSSQSAPDDDAPVDPTPPAPTDGRSVDVAVAVAAMASLGAGAIHAAAIGVHSDVRATSLTFTVVAAIQIAWGAAALARTRSRAVLLTGLAVHGAAVVGWVLAKSVGIGFIDGLDTAESVQLADGVAAALAATAGVLTAWALIVPAASGSGIAAAASRFVQQPGLRLTALAVPVAALTVAAMVSTGSHSHEGGDHAHGDEAAADGHAHDEPAVNLGPFDPDDEIDLSGVPGVSAEEQAQAEALLQRSLDKLPQFDDLSTLNDRGFYSIGDAVTGDEHYINWSYVNDDKVLDPDYPESLVIRHDGGEPYLAAAMYMLPNGTTLDDVPDVGGDLVQWHVHNDLCLTDDPVAPTLAFNNLVVDSEQECIPPNSKRANVPMVHVWIVPHPCGPFAALEGIGGGQIKEGEEKLCTAEHAHAAPG